jgi:hypothetical protein
MKDGQRLVNQVAGDSQAQEPLGSAHLLGGGRGVAGDDQRLRHDHEPDRRDDSHQEIEQPRGAGLLADRFHGLFPLPRASLARGRPAAKRGATDGGRARRAGAGATNGGATR